MAETSWREELLWAAGLFEGEGSAGMTVLKAGNNRGGRRGNTPRCQARLSMTDEDSVRRFHAAIGMGTVHGPTIPAGQRVDGTPYKAKWTWALSGFERFQALAALLWLGLGQRRRAKFRETIEANKVYKLHRDPATGRWLPWAAHG